MAEQFDAKQAILRFQYIEVYVCAWKGGGGGGILLLPFSPEFVYSQKFLFLFRDKVKTFRWLKSCITLLTPSLALYFIFLGKIILKEDEIIINSAVIQEH